MRATAATLAVVLLAGAGCDRIFGLEPTTLHVRDGAGIDAKLVTLSLTEQLLTGQGTSSTITYPPADGLSLQGGPFDEPLHAISLDAAGSFQVPDSWTSQVYRLVYATPGDSVTHEVQWQGGEMAHLVLPVWGREPRIAPPSGQVFRFHISSNLPPYFSGTNTATVFTAGLWTVGGVIANSADIIYPYPMNAASLSGPLGTPTAAQQDEEVLAEIVTNGSNQTSVVGFAKIRADLTTGTSTNNAPWKTTPSESYQWGNVGGIDPSTRVPHAGNPPMGVSILTEVTVSEVPSTKMPVMSELNPTGGLDDTAVLPQLAFQKKDLTPLTFVDPFTASDEPNDHVMQPAFHYRRIVERMYSGVAFDSGFQEIQLGTGNQMLEYGVGIANNVVLGTTDLIALTDGSTVMLPSNGVADLQFSIDGGTRTTDCTVTLYHVVPPNLVPLHTYLVLATNPHVRVSTSDMTTGEPYAFAIACTDQHMMASANRFDTIGAYPLNQSRLVPSVFTAMLQ